MVWDEISIVLPREAAGTLPPELADGSSSVFLHPGQEGIILSYGVSFFTTDGIKFICRDFFLVLNLSMNF